MHVRILERRLCVFVHRPCLNVSCGRRIKSSELLAFAISVGGLIICGENYSRNIKFKENPDI